MNERYVNFIQQQLHQLKEESLYKVERVIQSQQQGVVSISSGDMINLCANNYLGLANDKAIVTAAHEGLERYGYGMASVRFICGTQTPHHLLEKKISAFLRKEDAILYSSCFDANAGLFETLLGEEDAIISDALNHASIIDGVRLCKAQRFRYANNDMDALKTELEKAQSARFRLIATDGVFSMDGTLANLPDICELARQYDALVMVDDSHAVGFMGKTGRGTPEHFGVEQEVDVITGTLGKALGGASGGYTAGHSVIVDWLRQRSRPYLFSNTLAPMIAHTSIEVLDTIEKHAILRDTLFRNTVYFRKEIEALGFRVIPGEHPIIPIMLGEADKALNMASKLLDEGVYVVGFSYPVVPKGLARIRTQMSAAHTLADLEKAVAAFKKVGQSLGVI